MCAISATMEIEQIIQRHPAGRDSLIPILQEAQEARGYLSVETVDELAVATGISANEIYGVASFYTQFRFRPPAEHSVCVCQGTACHIRGGKRVLEEFESILGVKAGETTADGKFDLERVACVGCCALGPVAVVDGEVHARVAPKKVKSVIGEQ